MKKIIFAVLGLGLLSFPGLSHANSIYEYKAVEKDRAVKGADRDFGIKAIDENQTDKDKAMNKDFGIKAIDQEKVLDENQTDKDKAMNKDFGIKAIDQEKAIDENQTDKDKAMNKDFGIKAIDQESGVYVLRGAKGVTIVRDGDNNIVIHALSPDGCTHE